MQQFALMMFWLAFCVFAIGMSARRPLIGYCSIYVICFFCLVKLQIPFLHTPLGVMVVMVALLSLAHPLGTGMGLMTPIKTPWLALIGVLLIMLLIQHGDPGICEFRVRTYIMGMWPFVLACLILKTPRDARIVLITALAVISVVALLLFIAQITIGRIALEGAENTSMRTVGDESEVMGYLNYGVLVAMATASPVLLSMGLQKNIPLLGRLIAYSAWGVGVFCILYSSYGSPLVALILGNTLLLVIHARRILRNIISLMVVGVVLLYAVRSTNLFPGVRHTIDRVWTPSEDGSGSYRLQGIQEETKAFLEAPWIGHGAKAIEFVTPRGNLIFSHNSITRDAASFGLMFVIPFVSVLVILGNTYIRLIKRLRWPEDIAIAKGMFVSFIVSIATGFITCTFGDFTQDTYFWTFTSVLLFWNHWNKRRPHEPLFAWGLRA